MDEDTARQFLRDREGKVLWFTVPPLETGSVVAVGHSLKWLARRGEIEEKKRKREVEREEERERVERERREKIGEQRRKAGEVLVRVLEGWGGRTE